MGCGFAKRKGQQYEQQAQVKQMLSTKTQYISYLLQQIVANPNLTVLLHHSIFQQLILNFNYNYWSDEKKTALIHYLQDYIKLSLSNISDQIPNTTKYTEIDIFDQIYGKQMHKLENQVKMKCHWMLQSLDFSTKFFQYKFCLNDNNQILKITEDVKYLCQKQMLSMFYLSSYFVKCCEKLQNEGKSIVQISELLKKKAVFLKKETGVQGIKKRQAQYVSREDQSIQIAKIKNFNIDDNPVIFYLADAANKQQQLQKQILNLVSFAKQNLPFFNDLLYNACTKNEGFGFKSNLKLTSKQNKSALHRVKQKLLKKELQQKAKPKQQNQAYKACSKILQRVKVEEQYVDELMKEIYQEIQSVPFTVSDLLRGKCLFNKVAHINKAAEAIKTEIQKLQKNGRNVKLVQIDNRLGKFTKDLVFKIKIQDLVCQFQMALFFKQAQNQINHKMYEMGRSKILTQIALLYQWNKKSTTQYFSLISNIIPFTDNSKKIEITMKNKKLMNFLNIDCMKFKSKQQEKYINIKQMEIVENIRKITVNGQKLDSLKKCKKLRSLQYLIEQKQQLKALQLSKLAEFCCEGDEFILSCQHNSIGSIHKNLGKYPQALDNYTKSLELKSKVKGEGSIDCAQILNNIGLVYVNMKKYVQAINYYGKSLEIKQQLKGSNSIQCAQTLNNIGLVYDYMRKYQDSLSYYKRSLSIKQQIKGKDSIDCAQTLNNIGLVFSNMNKNAQALDSFSRSLTIKQKKCGKDSIDCAQTLNNLGTVYRKMGKHKEALDYYNRSIAIKQKVKGKCSMDYAQTLGNIGTVYENMGQFKTALEYFKESLSIKQQLKGRESPQSIQLQNIIEKMTIKIEKTENSQSKQNVIEFKNQQNQKNIEQKQNEMRQFPILQQKNLNISQSNYQEHQKKKININLQME